ncbi:lipid A deacylase LpxR family protein [Flavobacterium soli]|uniref:lipid A deacylase LpxR family protein n=1 Tax=Flavobacterium soli TaxID=344881 RepID=UPI0003FA79E8|nr:lipid A deacylase LpxR family protein [Flavobacterium soli]
MLKKSLLLFLFVSCYVLAQKKPTEIGIVFDNDLYTSTVNDKYYTNGFEFFYRYLIDHKNEKVNKKIIEFRLGQYIYNPQTIRAGDIFKNDRPFAGYLFGEAGLNTFYNNQSVLKINGQIGYVGPNAFGEEVQRGFHDVFGYRNVYGWQYQIKNAFAIQANVFYSVKLFPKKESQIDAQFQGEASVGTIFNSVTVGPVFRFSLKRLLPVYNSNLYDGSLRADKNYKEESEFYFYASPKVNYQAYDATIQGSMFNDNSPVTFPLEPFRFNAEAGLKYRKNHWNLSYSFLFRGREAKNNVIEDYFYGSIGVGYLLD